MPRCETETVFERKSFVSFHLTIIPLSSMPFDAGGSGLDFSKGALFQGGG